jgi:hypothetical protein
MLDICPACPIRYSSYIPKLRLAVSPHSPLIFVATTLYQPPSIIAAMAAKKKPLKRPTPQKQPSISTASVPKQHSTVGTPRFNPVNSTPAIPIPYGPGQSSSSRNTVPFSSAQWLPSGEPSDTLQGPIVSPLQLGGPIKIEIASQYATPEIPWQFTKMSTLSECYAELGMTSEDGNELMYDV